MNYTEVEGKVREATSDEAWGPTGQQMQELALATFTYEHFPEVMSMLWRRMLHDNKAHWRRTYKVKVIHTRTEHYEIVFIKYKQSHKYINYFTNNVFIYNKYIHNESQTLSSYNKQLIYHRVFGNDHLSKQLFLTQIC